MSRSFDADAKTDELLNAPVTIGSQVFNPRRLTPDLRKAQMALATVNAKTAQEAGLAGDAPAAGYSPDQLDKRAEAVSQIDQGIYAQIAVLLQDTEGRQPQVEFLAQHLDNRVAGELLGWLLNDEDSAGESTDTPTPAASTP